MSKKAKADSSVTELLQRAASGETDAREELYNMIYDDMRAAAARVLRQNYRGDFQTTALVNESLLRFEKEAVLEKYSKNRRIFFYVAIQAMQQILVDHYRNRKRETTVPDDDGNPFEKAINTIETQTGVEFSRLNDALERLKASNPRQYSIIVHRFFGGLTIPQTAELLEVSEGTVQRDWRLARAKLLLQLKKED